MAIVMAMTVNACSLEELRIVDYTVKQMKEDQSIKFDPLPGKKRDDDNVIKSKTKRRHDPLSRSVCQAFFPRSQSSLEW